jgi:hypothetical protein
MDSEVGAGARDLEVRGAVNKSDDASVKPDSIAHRKLQAAL